MIRDWKALEEFVAHVEREAAMQDAKVTSNVKEYGDDGKQIAEFDIVVEGRFGTVDIKWLIECRDRPSAGAAEKAWIEQLIGRKQLHGFDRVTAVSTTGFARGCEAAAERGRIELRTVEEVNAKQFADWFAPEVLEHVRRRANLRNVAIEVEWGSEPQRLDDLSALLAQGGDAVQLWSDRDQAHCIPGHAFLAVVSANNLWDGLAIGEVKPVSLLAEYPEGDRFLLELSGGRVAVSAMRFDGEIWIERDLVPIAGAAEYAKAEGEVLAQKVQFQFPIEERTAALEIVKLGENGPSQVRIRIIE